MQVLVLNSCPQGLRGDVTRWFMELAPGVYVGRVSARVRDALWERIVDSIGHGRALLIYPARNEQGYIVRSHQYGWDPVEFDGLTLMRRPYDEFETADNEVEVVLAEASSADIAPKGWSTAARRRHYRGHGQS